MKHRNDAGNSLSMAIEKFFPDKSGPSRATFTDEVLGTIRRAILSGRFIRRNQLTESRISKEFGVSRAPVREALGRLVAEGLVTHSPHRGFFVRVFTREDIEELMTLRAAIEKLAIRLAIERADENEIKSLEKIIGRMESAVKKSPPDMEEASIADYEFHKQICHMARHKRLMEVWDSMAAQASVAIANINQAFKVSSGFIRGHKGLLDAIRSGDADKAEKAIEDHIRVGLENLVRKL
jgi:DNA-binding GntR family transcriptional regulator